jgi:AcrR family transcriptional regulator
MYDTFGDKHALYLACLRRYIDQVEAAKDEAVSRATTLQGALRELLGPPHIDREAPAGCFAALAAADVTDTDTDTEVRDLVATYFDRSEDRVRTQIRRFLGRVPAGADPVVTIACDAALGYRVRARSGHADPRQIDDLVTLICEHL